MPCGTYMMQRTTDALIGVGYFSSGMLVPPKSTSYACLGSPNLRHYFRSGELWQIPHKEIVLFESWSFANKGATFTKD